ncbi:5-methyltetrahydropteroyltriglutamate--homocysteine methyltransferase [Rhodopseudomonas rhenobacensis]|uniref:5-methyltetrahydropteroyltriglutamate--homocysteine methyltransferase n=1 Tax=Rhodopseudomonas rhenobacensis TaxID=87461 RepID=A0A7W7Z321_9BRAD|nr:5-methyltetrahydropteroyltriglutamate--homocysteine S-methyltransferase [Rhodopseudomonas rhenobacensis]MBB5047049.1 5-methyltetrahydropteroyltriglutamate--homocysteine methyltransferase [Rhodopseudomonas rhenobacensis]
MQRTRPPFRAEHVGSLLRPPKLEEARGRFAAGAITADDLRKIEDVEIEKLAHKQSGYGLKLATDGGFRGAAEQLDFFTALGGCEPGAAGGEPGSLRVTGKLEFPDDHPLLSQFKHLQRHAEIAHVTPKLAIPSPALLHWRSGPEAIASEAYPSLGLFFEDLAKTYRRAVKALYDAGCRYLQFDDPVWAHLCSEAERQMLRQRGEDAGQLQQAYTRVINYAIAERPSDIVITSYAGRGAFRGNWLATGGYERVAETLLAGTHYDGYLLEFEPDRAGGFEALRFLPKGNKTVVLGLIDPSRGALERKDDLKRRIAEAAALVPLEQLALSPQSGFAEAGLSEDQQWDKLRLAVEVAQEVWGR